LVTDFTSVMAMRSGLRDEVEGRLAQLQTQLVAAPVELVVPKEDPHLLGLNDGKHERVAELIDVDAALEVADEELDEISVSLAPLEEKRGGGLSADLCPRKETAEHQIVGVLLISVE
jgi:hypothetical protein